MSALGHVAQLKDILRRNSPTARDRRFGTRLLIKRVFEAALVAVVRFQLLLHGEDLLVALVQPLRECNHDVPLLQQQVLVAVDLRVV